MSVETDRQRFHKAEPPDETDCRVSGSSGPGSPAARAAIRGWLPQPRHIAEVAARRDLLLRVDL
jgi:hypothetical protein